MISIGYCLKWIKLEWNIGASKDKIIYSVSWISISEYIINPSVEHIYEFVTKQIKLLCKKDTFNACPKGGTYKIFHEDTPFMV
jgi:hypothetical protein